MKRTGRSSSQRENIPQDGRFEESQTAISPSQSKRRMPAVARDVSSVAKKVRAFIRGEDDYCPGNIVKVELKHFMTYDYIQTMPGPRLNLVIGPNGTGKSSLVCAICLGLGGDPKLLGRAVNVGEYVQRGHENGSIKITLRGEDRDKYIEVTRKITATNKTEWMLDGRPCRKEDVKDVTQKFNIQVGNLTQFLPQDKVCEFAKLSSVDLLSETEKAVGDPELFQQHEYLVEKKTDLFKIETSVEQSRKHLEGLRAENAELERDVERVAARDAMLKKSELMRMKLPWLEYDKVKSEYLDVKEKYKEAKKRKDSVDAQHRTVEAPFIQARKQKLAVVSQIEKSKAAMDSKEQQRKNLSDEEEDLSLKIQAKEAELEQVHRQAEVQKAKAERAREEYDRAKAEWEAFVVSDVDTDNLKCLEDRLYDIGLTISRLEKESREAKSYIVSQSIELNRIRDRLKEAESWRGKIVQALVSAGERNLHESIAWLNANRHRFKGAVFGPVATEIEVHDPQHAKFLEQHVPFWVWKAFITTCDEDRDLLMTNIKADVINCTNTADRWGPSNISQEAARLGVTHRMDEVFKADIVVLTVLRVQAALHRSFIGTPEAEDNAQAITALGIQDLWTPQYHYRWTKSAYHSHVVTTSNVVRPCRIFSSGSREEIVQLQKLGGSVDHNLKLAQSRAQDLEGERTRSESESKAVEEERAELRKKHLNDKQKKKELALRVDKCLKFVDSFSRVQDPAAVEDKIRKEISAINDDRHKKVMQATNLLLYCAREHMAVAPLQLRKLELDFKVQELEGHVSQSEEEVKRAAEALASLESRKTRLQGRLREALEAGKKVVDLEKHPEIERQFADLPGSIEELSEAIEDLINDANAILCPNPDIVLQYGRRKQQIEALEGTMRGQVAELEAIRAGIEEVKEKWLSRLRDLVSKINQTFGQNFAEMAVAGEVSLDEQGMDFDKYGILIKVKFRESGDLQVLSATHQSGGERSVSTILYLVSLQAITQCPFRVVDEINQGMDLHNERKMFQQLVRAASLPNTPQCFLLTPKLLSDLDYGTSCSVLNIMNGPYITDAVDEGFKAGESLSSVLHNMMETS